MKVSEGTKSHHGDQSFEKPLTAANRRRQPSTLGPEPKSIEKGVDAVTRAT